MVERLIHRSVSCQAISRRDAVAVVHGAGITTYGELDELSDAWAARLAECGVGPGVVVPVRLPRSLDLVVALLAVLKCGAAYAALDMRWPRQRVHSILERLDPPLLIGDSGTSQDVAPLPGGIAYWEPPTEPYQGTAHRVPDLEESAPACVFFTSGTTGIPKGVVSPHGATTRLFSADGPLPFGPGTVLAQAAPAPWDAFSLELWGALTTGGRLVLIEGDYLFPHTVEDLIVEFGVNTMWLTASLFNFMVEEDIECFAGLDRMYIGGERLSPVHVEQFVSRHSSVALFNGYGPVESCVFATVHLISKDDVLAENGIPIGRPVPETSVYILKGDQPASPGEIGEVCIAGSGLALGYLHNEALTREKFVDVDVDGIDVRVYRSGDLAYADDAGVLHFVGRSDQQIKVRGHRIEPAEIEVHGNAVPGVAQCAVVPLRGTASEYEGLAFLYTSSAPAAAGAEASTEEEGIRSLLREKLPSYVVPDVIKRLERFPVTANGKVDRAALASAVVTVAAL
ncbi:amino acid adenylation domain-containing protein [Streptomyces murinus]|uniref:amino acid adenylation domain-containing protein n=1 Tax=Streptomyces murinus TaxID=33900 RepID=UPI003800F357